MFRVGELLPRLGLKHLRGRHSEGQRQCPQDLASGQLVLGECLVVSKYC